MKNQKGFSLIELLIVVAIILIIAAIAIPSLLRARIAANESSTVGDIRTVISAEATFQSTASFYCALSCLSAPNVCFTAAGTTPMVDQVIALGETKNGYDRSFVAGTETPMQSYVYGGVPDSPGRTGIKGFAGDEAGVVCWDENGNLPTPGGGACDHPLGRLED